MESDKVWKTVVSILVATGAVIKGVDSCQKEKEKERWLKSSPKIEISTATDDESSSGSPYDNSDTYNNEDGIYSYDDYGVQEEPEHIETPHYSRVKVQCSYCGGEGFTHENLYMGNGHIVDRKSRCTFCHGKGTVEETREEWY